MIPRQIHQVWIGPKEAPSHIREWCAHWKGLNPEWEHRLWGNELYDVYRDDPYIRWFIETGEQLAFVADRFRVLLLRDHGGLYVDADAEPVRPLRVLNRLWDRPDMDFMTGIRSPDRKYVALHRGISLVDNTVMASQKGGRVIGRICGLYTPERKRINGYQMGLEVIRNVDETVVLMNFRYFYDSRSTAQTVFLHDDRNLASWSVRRGLPAPVLS